MCSRLILCGSSEFMQLLYYIYYVPHVRRTVENLECHRNTLRYFNAQLYNDRICSMLQNQRKRKKVAEGISLSKTAKER